jgi:GxxExxY protein
MTLIADPLVQEVIGCAITVHRALGPGLLEGAIERCLGIEFRHRQISYATHVAVPLRYRDIDAGCAYRVDFLVERRLVVEVKSVERLLPIHTAQVLTYLHLLDAPQGLLINFNGERLKDGLKSVINKRHATFVRRSPEESRDVSYEE